MSTGGNSAGGVYAEMQLDTAQMTSALKAAEQRMKSAETDIKLLIAQLNAGSINADKFGSAMSGLTGKFSSAKSQVEALNHALAGGGASAGQVQQRFTALGYAFQDFTSTSGDLGMKLNSISNNLPQLFAGMGGLGTAIAGAGVAATVLYRNWDGLMASMGMGKVLTEAQQMDQLADATSRTADEQARLNKFRKEEAAGKAQLEARPEREEKAAKDVRRTIVEADSNKVDEGLVKILRGRGAGEQSTAEEKGQSELRHRMVANAMKIAKENSPLVEQLKARAASYDAAVADRKTKADMAVAAKERAKAETDPTALKALLTKVQMAPGAFPPGFAESLKATMRDQKTAAEHEGKLKRAGAIGLTDDQQKKADEAAESLKGGAAGHRALLGSLTREKVAQALKASGFDENMAGNVLVKLQEDAAKKVSERAAKEGIDEVEARRRLLRENAPAAALAKTLEGGAAGHKALQGRLTNEDVLKQLQEAKVEHAETYAPDVAAKLRADAAKAVKDRASKEGISEAEAKLKELRESPIVARLAGELGGGVGGRQALQGKLTGADVLKQLKEAGVEGAETYAPDVAAKMRQNAADAVKARQAKEQITEAEARARELREDQRTGALAGRLETGEYGRKALQGKLTDAEVLRQLQESKVEHAETYAPGVAAKMRHDAEEKIKARQEKEGGISEAQAREKILSEDQTVASLAAKFGKGKTAGKALRGGLNEADVLKQLKEAGVEDAEQYAPDVTKKIKRDARERIHQRMRDEGEDFQTARAELVQKDRDEDEQKREAKRHAAAARAEKAAPGAGDEAERLTLGIRTGQITVDQARKRIRAALKAKGLDDKEADEGTAALGEAASKSVDAKVRQAVASPEVHRSETFDASSLHDKVQAGVSDNGKNMVEWQKKAVELLGRIAGQGGIDPYGTR